MHASIANISQVVSDRLNYFIAIEYEIQYDLSIGTFTLDIGHCEDECQCHALFHWEYLINGHRDILKRLQSNGATDAPVRRRLPTLARHPPWSRSCYLYS